MSIRGIGGISATFNSFNIIINNINNMDIR